MAPPAPRSALVALSSDVGSAYAAQMKAVLLATVDPSRIIDLTHDLTAHGIAEAAFVVRAIGTRLPVGTIHVVVVDPGVGTTRAAVAVACRDGSILLGPDNGVLAPLAHALGIRSVHRIERDRLPIPSRVGTTFDGRDLFAPAAAALATVAGPGDLGPRTRLLAYRLPVPERRPGRAVGEIVHVDRFGNLVSNVPSAWIPGGTERVRVAVGKAGPRSVPWASSYAGFGSRRWGALGSSFGTVEVAVREGRAADSLHASVGTRIRLAWSPPRRRG